MLVLVLVVVALCGVLLTASARRCGQRALQAVEAQRSLQFRWGASSCQAVILGNAEERLNNAWQPGADPPAEVRDHLVLGGMEFGLILSDETAKANLNVLAEQYARNSAGLLASIGKLQAGGRRVLSVEMRPLPLKTDEEEILPIRYKSFDQAFVTRSPSEFTDAGGSESTLARRRMTCWGPAQVNLRRAEIPVLREVLAGIVTESQLAALADWRKKDPEYTLSDALVHMQLTEEQIDQMIPLTIEASNCHSVWVFAKGPARQWHRLYVRQADEGADAPQRWTFAW